MFLKLLLSTCLYFKTISKLVGRVFLFLFCFAFFFFFFFFFCKVDLFAPSLVNKEVIISCSFDFDLKKKIPPKKSLKKIHLPAPNPKKLWRTTKQLLLFFFLLWPKCEILPSGVLLNRGKQIYVADLLLKKSGMVYCLWCIVYNCTWQNVLKLFSIE